MKHLLVTLAVSSYTGHEPNKSQIKISSLDNSMFHEREKRRNYTMEFKRKAVKYTEKNSNHKAAEKIYVAFKRIREWRQNQLKIFEPTVKPINKRLEGSGRKTTRPTIRKPISLKWIYDRRPNGLRVSKKLIMAKVKYFYKSKCHESDKSLFVASNGWVNNFMRRNGFFATS